MSAGLVAFPQGADRQSHRPRKGQKDDNFSRGHNRFLPSLYCAAAATEVRRRDCSSP